MKALVNRNEQRKKRHSRIRRQVRGTPERPRLCVYMSLRHISVQLVDDTLPVGSRTLAAASTMEPELRTKARSPNQASARLVGQVVAERAIAQGIREVVFDRSGYPYHGRVRAVAEAAREGGLRF